LIVFGRPSLIGSGRNLIPPWLSIATILSRGLRLLRSTKDASGILPEPLVWISPHGGDSPRPPCRGSQMKMGRVLFASFCVFALTGCYAASVDTGRPPSAKVISKPWASSWIFGLVPPPAIQTATECPNGVAKVETQLSFLNQLVGALTFGIYTPMQIVVTCAEEPRAAIGDPDPAFHLARNASLRETRDTFRLAAEEAMRTRKPVLVAIGE
jgi:hypothetical protein